MDFGELAASYERAAGEAGVERLARSLGLSLESLRRLRVGFDGRAFTFPMRTPDGSICGIRRRFPNGRKLAVRGSREGLFIPDGLPTDGLLFIAEGPTDTAALLTLGFAVIGRPSCSGGMAFVVQVARARDVVIVADRDGAGQRGAIRLACVLRPVCASLVMIVPPPAVKDARQWLRAGATRRDIELTLRSGPIVNFAEHTDRADGVKCCVETG